MYMVQSYHVYFDHTRQNLYRSKKVTLPVPEIYVICTGDRKTRPAEVSLAQEFFKGYLDWNVLSEYLSSIVNFEN